MILSSLLLLQWLSASSSAVGGSVGVNADGSSRARLPVSVAALAPIREQSLTDPWGAVASLEALAEEPFGGVAGRVVYLEAFGDALRGVRRFDLALGAHREAAALCASAPRGSCSVNQEVRLIAAIASDLKDGGQAEAALAGLTAAMGALAPSQPQAAALLPVLHKQQASLLQCVGEDVRAMAALAQSVKLLAAAAEADGAAAAPGGLSIDDALQHVGALLRLRANASLPQRIAQGVEMQYTRITGELLRRGPWTSALQLPRAYQRGLLARPWHSFDEDGEGGGDFAALRPAVRLLRERVGDLIAEFDRLAAGGLLENETECIHDRRGGAWRHYTANAVHHQAVDAESCSTDTPVSCALLRDLGALNLPHFKVLRVGFSALGPHARLHPHFGLTNAQLKFHLGLRIPGRGEGRRPCAFMKVGNTTRAWSQGKVLFFDDSFQHSVENRCDEERVVFQVVFAHPGLAALSGDASNMDPFGRGPGAAAKQTGGPAATGETTSTTTSFSRQGHL